MVDPVHKCTPGCKEHVLLPLQPLQDNLKADVYDDFERDVTKYNKYAKAIYMTLIDRVPLKEKDTNVQ